MTTDTSGTVRSEIAFHETPARTLRLDVYEPRESGPRPTVVLFHGGAFRSGEKTQLAEQARALADAGYVVVTPEYRLADEATFPAALIDAKAAVEWCRVEGAEYGIDPGRLAAAGYSAGANLATLVSVTADEPGFEPEVYPGASSSVAAAVGWAGIYDFRAFDEGHQSHADYLGGTREDVPEAYDFASPMGQTDVGTPPTLVVHGDADEVLPIEQARRYADAVDALSTAAFVVIEGGDHGFPDDAFDRTIEETDQFLTTQLGGQRDDGRPPNDGPLDGGPLEDGALGDGAAGESLGTGQPTDGDGTGRQ
ncbi:MULTISPECIES: alpha/beta hydrolase [Halomicrobium]|uniref:Alpha/beta hydrolase fold-3 domain protein n=2 Tax=Halomicrobium mukohataei TaxID=57705 RepID=C7NZE9_HALMD|nr:MULTISPECIES: alpha/beta hydrolase [Halomicrobium]ACV48717.1 Alpha/beta hydrolase fold-3 domain protein [Halomicrobium mukohataei DSM 12286]QCD64148.1 alpha/beta hydrolase [Halomicrobium mukohataei]QFR18954.1 alpha/beta hydrolase fold domain-containing protein [Halomicrobium sp. ZPS1]